MNTYCDPDKERAFLACLFRDPTMVHLLEAEDFCASEHRIIFEATRKVSLAGDGTRELVVLVRDWLAAQGTLNSVGGTSVLCSINNCWEFGTTSRQIALELRTLTLRRRATDLIVTMSRKNLSGEPIEAENERLSDTIEELGRTQAGLLGKPGLEVLEAVEFFRGVEDEVQFVLAPLLVEGGVVLLQGRPKSYKSTFALYIALMVAAGQWSAGEFEVPAAVPVLYISFEDGRRRLKQRIFRYLRALGVHELPKTLFLAEAFPINLASPGAADDLIRSVRARGIRLLVLDPFVYTHTADENDAKEMQPVCAALKRVAREAKCTTLLVHHVRKLSSSGDAGEVVDRGRGSSTIAGAADAILDWRVNAKQRRLECQMVSKDVEDCGFHATFSLSPDDRAAWIIEAAPESPESTARMLDEIKTAAVQALASQPGGICRRDLLGKTSAQSETTIGKYLDQLVEGGLLTALTGSRGAKVYALRNDPSPVN